MKLLLAILLAVVLGFAAFKAGIVQESLLTYEFHIIAETGCVSYDAAFDGETLGRFVLCSEAEFDRRLELRK